MSPRSRRAAVLFGALAVPLIAVPLLVSPAGAVGSLSSYTVPSGVEVLEVVLVGGSGGDSLYGADVVYPGGTGCRVQAALPVTFGAAIDWNLGGKGGSPGLATAAAQPGGAGGTGARPGGAGGAISTYSSFLTTYRGTGGGGASSVSVGSTEAIIAAGGGGASRSSSGGGGCPVQNSPAGDSGYGSGTPTATGASDPSTGGAGGNGSGTNPNYGLPGGAGSPAPSGAGGIGGEGRNYGDGGAGGGGGISGGGGGGGHYGTVGGVGSGAAGLSGVLLTGRTGLFTSYSAGTGDASLSVNVIQIPALESRTPAVGTPFSMTLGASFAPVLVADVAGATLSAGAATVGAVTWSLADGSPSLPAGLTLDPAGIISGSPSAEGTTTVTLAATAFDDDQYDGVDSVRARSVTTLTFIVGPARPAPPPPAPSMGSSTDPTSSVPASTTTEPPATTTTSPASPITAQTAPQLPGTLPATGGGSRTITLGGLTALLIGAGTLLLTRRRAR